MPNLTTYERHISGPIVRRDFTFRLRASADGVLSLADMPDDLRRVPDGAPVVLLLLAVRYVTAGVAEHLGRHLCGAASIRICGSFLGVDDFTATLCASAQTARRLDAGMWS